MTSVSRLPFLMLACLGLAPLTGCGGGGGSSAPAASAPATPPAPPPPPPYVPTAEDTGTPQLGLIKATGAFGRGYFGAGVTVAVFDTGLFATHAELTGRVLTGYDGFSNGGTDTTDWNNHGTAVSGVIAAGRNGTAPEGVAPQALLLPVRIADSSGSVTTTDAQRAGAINAVTSRGVRISNYSLNATQNITDLGPTAAATISGSLPATLAAWTNYVAQGGVVVVAAGNESKAEPGFVAELPLLFTALRNGWLAVGSVNASGTLSSFSNKCGPTAAFCLVAPGEGVLTLFTSSPTALANGSGTSFSAPAVSGALAVLLAAFPNLTAQQAAQILLQTANKSGVYADTSTYGQGLLDLEKATRPIGTMSVTSAGQSFPAESTAITLSSAFGTGLQQVAASLAFTAQDSFGRGYFVPLESRVRGPADDFVAANRLTVFGREDLTTAPNGVRYRFGLANDDGHPGHAASNPYWFQASMSVGRGWEVSFAFNGEPEADFGPGAETRHRLDRDLLKPQAVGDPYLALIDGASQAAVGIPTALGLLTVRFAVGAPYDPYEAINDAVPGADAHRAGRVMATTVSLGVPVGSRASVQFGAGTLKEEQSLLGALGAGAAQFGQARTSYASLGGQLALGQRFDFVAGFHAGVTDARGTGASIVADVSSVVTTAMGAGVTGHDLFTVRDRLALGISQPLRVASGNARLVLPYGVDSFGALGRQDVVAGLKADGREIDLQGTYALELSTRADLAFGVLVRDQPGNRADAPRDVLGVFRVDVRL